ncbi:MAG: hypothetical protein K9G58_00995 [Bacteroidales bacterium]|nr:hypothetical protein [Bacteroidales bacterium]MCF8396711.1 hypothetical protein [Bacteroidales bacterium]
MENTENQNQGQSPVVTVGDWFVTLLIMIIPLVNLIMLFVWGFGSSTNPNKANWAKASLIWLAISIVIWIIIGVIFGAAMLGLSR